jgi:hypothetical protein
LHADLLPNDLLEGQLNKALVILWDLLFHHHLKEDGENHMPQTLKDQG